MRAVECPKYGPPEILKIIDIEKPTPKENEVLVKIIATHVLMGDIELRSMSFPLWIRPLVRLGFGIRGPRKKIIGMELAGEIESVGKDVTRFKEGDAIFGNTVFGLGAYAEYTTFPENGLILNKPSNMSYEEASTIVTGGGNALHFLRKADIQPGEKVLINGAGGSIGTFGVQLAKMWGAEVTAIDKPGKLDMLKSIGADHVIDYTKDDFTEMGNTYDVIFDVAGKTNYKRSLNSLNEGGRYLLANPKFMQFFRAKWTSWRSDKKVVTEFADESIDDLVYLKELIEEGKLKAVIDRTYSLDEVVEAHRYVETGEKIGNVVITVI